MDYLCRHSKGGAVRKKDLPMTRDRAYKMDTEKNPWPFYADYDEDTALWCVFGVHSGFAYSNHCGYPEAERAALKMETELYEKRKAQ